MIYCCFFCHRNPKLLKIILIIVLFLSTFEFMTFPGTRQLAVCAFCSRCSAGCQVLLFYIKLQQFPSTTGTKNLGSLFRLIRALLRLCLGASRDLARREALFNVADAKVPPIQ